jgi:RNA polymerase sigma-70 factor, ECF subfamily
MHARARALPILGLGEFLFGGFGDVYFGRADVFDFDGGGAVDVAVVAVEADFAFGFVFVFGEGAVFDPEFDGAAGAADFDAVATAAAAEGGEIFLGGFFGEVAGDDVAFLFEFLGAFGEFLGLLGGGGEVAKHRGPETRETFLAFDFGDGFPISILVGHGAFFALDDRFGFVVVKTHQQVSGSAFFGFAGGGAGAELAAFGHGDGLLVGVVLRFSQFLGGGNDGFFGVGSQSGERAKSERGGDCDTFHHITSLLWDAPRVAKLRRGARGSQLFGAAVLFTWRRAVVRLVPTMAAFEDTDAALMKRVTQGDAAAFEELVEKYKQPVFNMIYRTLPDATEAEDLAQAVFVQVYKAAARYRVEAKFSTWLFTIARNLSLNEIRRRSRHPADSLEAKSEPQDDGPARQFEDARVIAPSERLVQEELVAKVSQALGDLPENQRTALTLFQEQELSYEEIAEILGTSLSATKSLIHRARETLKERLKPYLRTGEWKEKK